MNSWDQVTAGERPAQAASAGYVLLVSRISLGEVAVRSGAMLSFAAIAGSADIFLDGRILSSKASPLPEPLTLAIPPGRREVTIGLVLRAVAGEPVGLPAPVYLDPIPAAATK